MVLTLPLGHEAPEKVVTRNGGNSIRPSETFTVEINIGRYETFDLLVIKSSQNRNVVNSMVLLN